MALVPDVRHCRQLQGTWMNEHDDDLESTVHEGAEEESDRFPDTGDELDDGEDEDLSDSEPDLDEDESELQPPANPA